MSVQASKVFPKSSRTDRQRASTDRDFAGNSKEDSKAFIGLSKNLFAIHKNLGAIADLLKTQALNEKKEDDAELKKQQKDEDARQKSGAEKALEGILNNAVLKPIQKMKDTTAGIFERLIKVLGALGLGTIAVKALKGIEAWMEGDKSILEQLKKDIKTILGVAAGVFLAINVGLPLISSAIGTVIGSIGVGGAFKGVLALLGNPYVWLGIIAAVGIAYTGTELYKFLKGEYGPDGEGIGSYAPINQEAIAEIQEVGMEQYRINERNRIDNLLQSDPSLVNQQTGEMKNDAELAIMSMTNDNAKLLMAYNNRLRMSHTGNWDQWDPKNMSEKDTKLFNTIPKLIKNFRGEWAKFYSLAQEITALMDGARTFEEVPDNIMTKIDAMMVEQQLHKDNMIKYLDAVKASRKQMSNDGKNYLDAILRKNDMGNLLYNADWWGKMVMPGPILDAVQVKEGLTPGLRKLAINTFNNLGEMNTDLVEDIERMPEGNPVLMGEDTNSLSQNNNNSDLDISSSANAFTNENLSLANQISDYDAFNEKFNLVPFDISQDNTNSDSDITSTSFFAETDLPAFSIFDNDNFYRDLAQSNYGVYD